MKVLWLCNMMLPAVAEKLNMEAGNKEGWLTGLLNSFLEQERSREVELSVAFPVAKEQDGLYVSVSDRLDAYGFYEDTANPHLYDVALEGKLKGILEKVQPDVIHCFGTEFPHTLALLRVCPDPGKVLVGIQGVCQVIAKAYMADLPEKVYGKNSFRDRLKKDGLVQQKQKFEQRAAHEKEALSLAKNVAGRTKYDRFYAEKCNPKVNYYILGESLRSCFYEGEWELEKSTPHEIFIAQGDYPLKGLHYLLIAVGKLKVKYPDVTLKIAGNSLIEYATLKQKIKISGYGKYLRALIAQYGLEDCVETVGKLNAQQMKSRFLSCSVYVCCSANENSPNSLGEAMLLGVPCVAAAVGGIPDLFDENDGVLYRGSSFYLDRDDYGYVEGKSDGMMEIAEYLSQAVEKIWDMTKKDLSFCHHARAHAGETHDRDKNFLQTLEIYREICGRKL